MLFEKNFKDGKDGNLSNVSMTQETIDRFKKITKLIGEYLKKELPKKYEKIKKVKYDFVVHYYNYNKIPELQISIYFPDTVKGTELNNLKSGVKSFLKSRFNLQHVSKESMDDVLSYEDRDYRDCRNFKLRYDGNWIDNVSDSEIFVNMWDLQSARDNREEMKREENKENAAVEFRDYWKTVEVSKLDIKKITEYKENYYATLDNGKYTGTFDKKYLHKLIVSIKNPEKFIARIKAAKEIGWEAYVEYATYSKEFSEMLEQILGAPLKNDTIFAARAVIRGQHEQNESTKMSIYEAKHKLRMAGYKLIKE